MRDIRKEISQAQAPRPQVLVVGEGSAALHHIHALQTSSIKFAVLNRHPKTEINVRDRYEQRYGSGHYLDFKPLHLTELRSTTPELAIIASPTANHEACLVNLVDSGIGTFFIEKPLLIGSETLQECEKKGLGVFCGSQLTLRSSFDFFLNALKAEFDFTENLEITSAFIDQETNLAKAHPWNHNFTKSWTLDSRRYGGAAYEFAHALFFLFAVTDYIGKWTNIPRKFNLRKCVVQSYKAEFDLTFFGNERETISAQVLQELSRSTQISCRVQQGKKRLVWFHNPSISNYQSQSQDFVQTPTGKMVSFWESKSQNLSRLHLGLLNHSQSIQNNLRHEIATQVDEIISSATAPAR